MREIKFRAIFDRKVVEYIKWENCMWLYAVDQILWKAERQYAHTYLQAYTGLHDKNGKEIYEGDVVCSDRYSAPNFEVVFHDGAFRLRDDLGRLMTQVTSGSKVIGNIYENPELIDNSKEV